MNYFDLHCDTATCLYDNSETFFDTDCCINSEASAVFDNYYQVFAFWFNDKTKIRGFDYLKNAVAYFESIKKSVSAFPLFSIEGGGCIEGNLDNLFWLKEKSFRIFGLSWNGENELATGNATNPKKGLSYLGKEALHILEELDIVPDISHLSDAGVSDVFENTRKRVVATHSCCREIYGSMRNITDDMIKEIIDRRGLIGLNLYPAALSENPKISDLLFHAEHVLLLGGENTLAFGADWDGTELPDGISGLRSVPFLFSLFKETFSEKIAEKIFFDNAAEFFKIKE